MTEQDDARFTVLWVKLFDAYGYRPSASQMITAQEALSIYDIRDIENAINQAIRTLKYVPKIADIVEIIEGKNEDIKARLESKATQVYNKILRCLGGYDVVIEDPRACYALSAAFGSLRWLSSRPDNDYANQKDKESFVKAYVTAPDNLTGINHVFNGYKGTDGSPLVKFVGSISECKKIADDYYAKQGIKPRYSDYISTAKKQCAQSRQVTNIQTASSLEIKNFIEEIKAMTKI